MSTTEAINAGIPADVMAELEYAAQLAATGRKDPAFARRIAEEAARIREEVKHKYGAFWTLVYPPSASCATNEICAGFMRRLQNTPGCKRSRSSPTLPNRTGGRGAKA